MPPSEDFSEQLDFDSEKVHQQRAEDHGRLVRRRRLELGLKRPAFVSEIEKLGHTMSADYLNKLEAGTRQLANASPALRDAIRQVLGMSRDEWKERTGLYTPDLTPTPPSRALSAAAKGHRIPRPTVEIPDALREAAEQYGHLAAFAGLNERRWQHFMASVSRRHTPETPEGWLEEFTSLKRMGYDPQEPEE